tara:strand:- start:1253 stop:1942 length:690 start_codon:yes stop_codon:yes gene_type:complete
MFLNPIIRTQNKPLFVVNKSDSTDWLPDDEVDAVGMPHTNPFTYVANVLSGQQIYGSNTSTPGCKLISAIAGGSAIVIINNGKIDGHGGGAGATGGPAFDNDFTGGSISIDNTNGEINGGGGGGGAGGAAIGKNSSGGKSPTCSVDVTAAGGAGGAGYGPNAQASGSGGSTAGNCSSATGGTGGTGGAKGTAGATGGNSGASGGAAGAAVTGDSSISWVATGTRNGAVS